MGLGRTVAIRIASAGQAGQDRAAAQAREGGHLLVLADGAGGTSGGAEAADSIVSSMDDASPASATECVDWLERLDRDWLAIGQSTAIVARVMAGFIFGASVGDSEAWLVRPHEVVELTERQQRKPLLGSGVANPVPFGPMHSNGLLLLASDGLFKYVPRDRIRDILGSYPFPEAADALITAARLRSGRLQDDVALILSA